MRPNILRDRLHSGRPTSGTHIHTVWPAVAELAGRSGVLEAPGPSLDANTADRGLPGPDAVSPTIGTLYPSDTSLQADGRTRVLGYTRQVSRGAVAYLALGRCLHNPAVRGARGAEPVDTAALTFRGAWETDAFATLLRNAIA